MKLAFLDTPIITIDGPSSSGKGTISKLLAEKLGWHFLDSGAVYRALALITINNKISLSNIPALINVINLINSLDAPAIRSEECGITASKIAVIPEVRAALIPFLRGFSRPPGLVADGRDMGTVVFPNAKLKIFLTASVEERAKRRLLQLQGSGINANLDAILQGLIERDNRDESRDAAPSKPDSAAIIIDTTDLSVDEVLHNINLNFTV